MKKIVALSSFILLLNATFAANEKITNTKKTCMEALWTPTDNCGTTVSVVVSCCGASCNPGSGGNMEQAAVDWMNANYYLNNNGCFVPRSEP